MAIQYYADQNIEGKLTVSTVLRVNDNDRVGINTMNPGGELQVVGAGSIGNIYISANAAGSSVTDSLHIKKEALKASIINRDGGDLALGANSNEYVTIKSTGNVGIGTTSPDSKLHIDSTGEALRFTRSSQETYRVIHGTSGLYFTGPNTGSLVLGVTQNSDVDIFNTSGSVMFRADGSSGNVGIGTTSPSTKLHVVGTLRAGGSSDYIELNSSGNIMLADSNCAIGPVYTGSPNNTLNIGFTMTGIWQTINHHATEFVWNPGVFGNMDAMNLSSTGDLLIKGDVGIGTTSPLEKLQVNGNAAIYGDIKGYVGSSSNQYLSILQSSTFTYISTGTTNETIYFGIGPVSNVTNISVAGTATATNFILSSDKTLKDKIKNIKANHVDVKWKNFELISEPGVKRSGVIAQELEAKHPEFIRTDKDGLKSVAYIDLLITKIAELEARLEKAGL